jgi:hypothetical protein
MSGRFLSRGVALVATVALVMLTGGALAQSSGGTDVQPVWQVSDSQRWALRRPDAMQSPVFRGLTSQDQAGGAAGGILYPGYNAGGFIAAILTHALINESVKSSQRNAAQQEADKVLEPYKPALVGWLADDLTDRTVMRFKQASLALSDRLVAAATPSVHWVVESAPLFSMTQDRQALLVESEVTVRRADAPQIAHRSVVRVVGQPIVSSGAQEHWGADGGERLKSESSLLHAQAVGLAIEDMLGLRASKDARQRTIRYPQGGQEIIERAEVLDRYCGYLVIRSLRGDLLSVPLSNAMAAAIQEPRPCQTSASANATALEPSLTAPVSPTKN